MAKILLSILFLFLLSCNLSAHGEKLVPCYFVFGDSLVDNGNNNARATAVKANYAPYGIDYPGGPTGRFSNGRNVADFIAEALGFTDHMPPFATANGDAFVNGVNYASGGSGILHGTGKQLGAVMSLDEQLQNHEITVNKIISALGTSGEAEKHLSQCIYSVGMGSNDYAAYTLSVVKSLPEQFATKLIDEYSGKLRDLYKSGARKVVLFGVGTIGCVPSTLAAAGGLYGGLCLSTTRATSGVFNAKVKALVDVLNQELVGAKFTFIDVFGITVSDPEISGLEFRNVACCTLHAGGMCVPISPLLKDRTKYEYFDGMHPTEATAMAVARRAFAAQSPSDAYPFDIQHLAQAE